MAMRRYENGTNLSKAELFQLMTMGGRTDLKLREKVLA
jgi:hypothetical protein